MTGGGLNDLMSADVRKQMAKYMPLYDGTTPPNIEGAYAIDGELVYSFEAVDAEIGDPLGEAVVGFKNQRNGNRTVDYFSYESGTYDEEVEYTVVGSGKNFTVVFVDNYEGNTDYGLLSGTVSSSGIKKLYSGSCTLTEDGTVDYVLVIKDSDGMSERTSMPSARAYEQPAAESKALHPLWRIAPFQK